MATKINIKNLTEGYQSIITNGKHAIVGDEPITSKGTDMGLAPTELVLAGLAMCKATTVRHIARKNGWVIKDVDAQLEQTVERGEHGLKTIVKINLQIEGELSDEQKEELIKQADRCYIHRLLRGEWEIDPIVFS
ncbi:MAG: OsmC family protein [Chitinophagaceae bacterium]